jgi:hypothetical protein
MSPQVFTPPVTLLQRLDVPDPSKLLPARVHPAVAGAADVGTIIELPGPLMPEGAEFWPKNGVWLVIAKQVALPTDLKQGQCVTILGVQFVPKVEEGASLKPPPLPEGSMIIPFNPRQS